MLHFSRPEKQKTKLKIENQNHMPITETTDDLKLLGGKL